MSSPTSNGDAPSRTATDDPTGSARRLVDWVIAAILVLAGVVSGVGGYVLRAAADRAAIAEAVAAGTLRSDVLTPAELVAVTHAVAWWGSVGLGVTGLLLLAGGVGYAAARSRARRAAATGALTHGAGTGTDAVVGAVVTVLTSFVPLSPVVGGAVAGYLRRGERRNGATVGALSGLAVALPVTVLVGFVVAGLARPSVGVAAAAGVVTLVALFVTVLFTVALSALGGYLGAVVAER